MRGGRDGAPLSARIGSVEDYLGQEEEASRGSGDNTHIARQSQSSRFRQEGIGNGGHTEDVPREGCLLL